MSQKEECDELIRALENFLEIIPHGVVLRLYVGDKLDDAPMSPEEFVDFSRKLLAVAKKLKGKYE